MPIYTHLEQAIKNLEIERERETVAIKERVMRERIAPFNQEMDAARDKAISEKQQELNAKIVALQDQFVKDKQKIIDAAENKKEQNATSVITTETYTVTVAYDKAISKLKEQIEELKQ